MANRPLPKGFGEGGKALWAALGRDTLTEPQAALLVEACRVRDRLDTLHLILSGDRSTWLELKANRTGVIHVNVDGVLTKAIQMAGLLANLLDKIPTPAPTKLGAGAVGGGKTGLEQLEERRRPGPRAATGKSTRSRTAERRRTK